MTAAEKLAASSDVAVVVVGLSPDWESEGFDRPTLDMPGPQNELIVRIAKANPNTVVCIQSVSHAPTPENPPYCSLKPCVISQGSVVAMPWVHDVHGIVHAWYAGNEAGNALADVLFGALNPSGRLPLTLPVRVQDIPAFPNFRSERGQIHYREDLLVGYKGYAARGIKPLFPFGCGLYTGGWRLCTYDGL